MLPLTFESDVLFFSLLIAVASTSSAILSRSGENISAQTNSNNNNNNK